MGSTYDIMNMATLLFLKLLPSVQFITRNCLTLTEALKLKPGRSNFGKRTGPIYRPE